MTNEIGEFLSQHFKTDDPVGHLLESPRESVEVTGSRRWWDDTIEIVKVGERYFRFLGAQTTGDDNAKDKGWEFDAETIVEVWPIEKQVTVRRWLTQKPQA